MSLEISVLCDYCGMLMAAAKTAAQARKDARESALRAVRTRDGEDLCGWCYDAKREDRRAAQHTEEGKTE